MTENDSLPAEIEALIDRRSEGTYWDFASDLMGQPLKVCCELGWLEDRAGVGPVLPAGSERLRMVTQRAFRWFCALGFVIVVLNTSFLLGNVPAAHGVLSLLGTPGTVATLPLHNVVLGGRWGVIGLIALANGLVYGLVARLIVWILSSDERQKHIVS